MSGMLSAAEVHELGKATLHQNLANAVSAVEDITSQRALARAAGLSHAHLAVVLAGNRRLTLTTAKNIAAALEA